MDAEDKEILRALLAGQQALVATVQGIEARLDRIEATLERVVIDVGVIKEQLKDLEAVDRFMMHRSAEIEAELEVIKRRQKASHTKGAGD